MSAERQYKPAEVEWGKMQKILFFRFGINAWMLKIIALKTGSTIWKSLIAHDD